MEKATKKTMKPFPQRASEVLNRLRIAYGELFAAVPGGVVKAVDLQRGLKIDMKLAWKVFRVATASKPLDAGPFMLGQANTRTLLKAGARLGVEAKVLGEIEAGMAEFERLVAECAGDRETFDSMIYSLVNNQDARQFGVNQRKAAYRANRHIHGSLAKAQSTLLFIQPSPEDPLLLDFASALGHHGLQRLREDAPLPTSFTSVRSDDFEFKDGKGEPVDAAAAAGPELGLLEEFCSKPLPEFRATRGKGGRLFGQLITPDIGMQGAIDWFTGTVIRGVAPRYRAENNLYGHVRSETRVPSRVFSLTLLLRSDTYGRIDPWQSVFRDTIAEPPEQQEGRKVNNLDSEQEQVAYLGRGPAVLHSPDLPRQAEMARYVFDHLGWDGEAFDVYQVRIEYPIIPSTVFISWDLPDSPSD